MALLYPWATKEYLLWNMTVGQIVMYHNIGLELKYPKKEDESPSMKDKSEEEVKATREELRRLYGSIDKPGGNDG